MAKLLLVIGGLLLVAYLALVGIHMKNNFDIGESFEMGLQDLQMAITCPDKPKVVWAYVDRTSKEANDIKLAAALFGMDVNKSLCAGQPVG